MAEEKQLKHLLMVDDSTTNLKCAAETLRKHYRLSMAKSGDQALHFLKKMRPDLILLDIKMPDMDGYETLKYIKDNPETTNIPVIFLTADSDQSSEIKGLKMGAMDYIRKPFEPEVMMSRIEKILQIEEMRKNLTISAQKDVLTGLWNRKYMEEGISRYAQMKNPSGVFMILDMDNFKLINDNFGHIMGDAVLIKFAETLRDVTKPEDIICRIGGDEFAMFLKGNFTKTDIAEIANQIITRIEDKVNAIKQEGYEVSVSVGISQMPEDSEEFIELYNKADKALYYVKQNGKRGYHFFHDKEKYSMKQSSMIEQVELQSFKQFVEEHGNNEGAYQVEYDNFKKIYQFVRRCVNRTKQKVQVALITLQDDSEEKFEQTMRDEMALIMKAISLSLRRGDVATQFSKNQYVIILMDSNAENGQKVVKRVIETYRQYSDNHLVDVAYDMDELLVD